MKEMKLQDFVIYLLGLVCLAGAFLLMGFTTEGYLANGSLVVGGAIMGWVLNEVLNIDSGE